MLSSIILWVGIFLESTLLIRSFPGRTLREYPFFYAYIASVVALWTPTYFVYAAGSLSYGKWYWCSQFATLIIGYGILLEIMNHVMAPYPGAEKFARMTGITAFIAIFCFAVICPLIFPQLSSGTTVEFERDLRTVQAVFIFLLLCVVSYYQIAIGRNMTGMILGYGLYIVTSLVSLAVRSYALTSLDRVWRVAQPISYDVSLLIWLTALWSYYPNPVARPGISLEADYEAFAMRTKNVIHDMRSLLGKEARQ